MKTFTITGTPVGKPRQTRSDKWKQRPCVMTYRDYADHIRAVVTGGTKLVYLSNPIEMVFYLPIPKSKSKTERLAMMGKPCLSTPDIDNLIKSCLDALLENDNTIYWLKAVKYWEDHHGPRTELTF